MEYVQERVTTLHDLGGASPGTPAGRSAVVVPLTEREHAGLAAERVFADLEAVDPARVVVPLRASADRVTAVREWLDGFDLRLDALWCDGPRLADLLDAAGLNGSRGKGRDVWLGLGRALAVDGAEFVVVHDADTASYSPEYVRRLLFPLTRDFSFSKGYYARVETDRLYGRLFRLLYAPLVRALADAHDDPFLRYLESFRYALAGEFAATRDLVASLRVPRTWGLEVGALADAYDVAGVDACAQVDLGNYEHDHRAVSGPTGLSDMSESVADTLLRTVEGHGVAPDYGTLPERYVEAGEALVRSYAADAAFNGLSYDRADERRQVDTYADAVAPPSDDDRLPPWADAPVSADDVAAAAAADADAAGDD